MTYWQYEDIEVNSLTIFNVSNISLCQTQSVFPLQIDYVSYFIILSNKFSWPKFKIQRKIQSLLYFQSQKYVFKITLVYPESQKDALTTTIISFEHHTFFEFLIKQETYLEISGDQKIHKEFCVFCKTWFDHTFSI